MSDIFDYELVDSFLGDIITKKSTYAYLVYSDLREIFSVMEKYKFLKIKYVDDDKFVFTLTFKGRLNYKLSQLILGLVAYGWLIVIGVVVSFSFSAITAFASLQNAYQLLIDTASSEYEVMIAQNAITYHSARISFYLTLTILFFTIVGTIRKDRYMLRRAVYRISSDVLDIKKSIINDKAIPINEPDQDNLE